MNNDESMPLDFSSVITELREKAEIFEQEADKYDGKLVYTLVSVAAACENHGDEEKYINTINTVAPDGGQRCFSDFSSAFDAYLKCLRSVERKFSLCCHNDWYYNCNNKYKTENLDCLFSCSFDELEEEATKKLSDLGKSGSGSFVICDFRAKPDSDATGKT